MSIIDFGQFLGSHERALGLRSYRTGVLAANIANADTPGYKARDFDFRSALAAVGGDVRLTARHPGHLGAGATGPDGVELRYRVPQAPSLDGNSVDLQVEQAEFAENAVQYQATLRFLRSRFSGLMNALRER
ncbi:MAG: hypothetical protein AMXMBFR26_06040 [Porticoccaceae bacterium]